VITQSSILEELFFGGDAWTARWLLSASKPHGNKIQLQTLWSIYLAVQSQPLSHLLHQSLSLTRTQQYAGQKRCQYRHAHSYPLHSGSIIVVDKR